MELRNEAATRIVNRSGRRTVVAILALALAVSGLALGPAPARAANGVADHQPSSTACAGAATEPAGFLDTIGLFAGSAIDCLAYYGITRGTLPNTFSPDLPVTRWQMALFLNQAAPLAGIAAGGVVDQGFQDIDGFPETTQDAINRQAGLGITLGTSATTFSPNSLVDRRQMALFLHRFLLRSEVGPGGVSAGSVKPDDTIFSDIADLDESATRSIRTLFEMAVTRGTTATTFSPFSIVTRAQMALFITRALAHTNARPAGVTMHATSGRVSSGDTLVVYVSARDQSRRPIAGGYLDMFTTPLARPTSSFDDRGRCVNNVKVVFDGRVCRIDGLDSRLDDRGNLLVVLQPTDHMALWAWTGAGGAEFALGGVPSDMVLISVLKQAAAVNVLDDLPPTAQAAPMGKAIGVDIQLVDEDGEAVADQGVRVQVSTALEVNGIRQRRVVRTHFTDENGRVALSFTGSDPSSTRTGDVVKLDLDIGAGYLEVWDRTTPGVVSNDAIEPRDVWYTWSDEAARTTTLRLAQTVPYHTLPPSAPGPTNSVIAFLTDQYGTPVPEARIDFTSDDEDGVGTSPASRLTNQSGFATLRYLWNSSDAAAELISARLADSDLDTVSIHHYWARAVPNHGSALGVAIIVADTRRNRVVVRDTVPMVISYTARDRLLLEGRVVPPAVFEEALDAGLYERVTYVRYSTDPEEVNTIELTNNKFDRAG